MKIHLPKGIFTSGSGGAGDVARGCGYVIVLISIGIYMWCYIAAGIYNLLTK
jgi:hypothetical protein